MTLCQKITCYFSKCKFSYCYAQLFRLCTSLHTTISVTHNFFGWAQCYSQLFLVTYIIMQNLFWLRTLLCTTFLVMYITLHAVFLHMHIAKHNWFGICTMLHTSFLVTHNFLSCTTSYITLFGYLH